MWRVRNDAGIVGIEYDPGLPQYLPKRDMFSCSTYMTHLYAICTTTAIVRQATSHPNAGRGARFGPLHCTIEPLRVAA